MFHIALKVESNFLLLVFFLKLLEQNQVGNNGTTIPLESKLRRLGGLKKLVKENMAALNESINFRERIIMAISGIRRVSLSPLIIIVIF